MLHEKPRRLTNPLLVLGALRTEKQVVPVADVIDRRAVAGFAGRVFSASLQGLLLVWKQKQRPEEIGRAHV